MSSSTSGERFSLKAGFVSLVALASVFTAWPSKAAVLNGGFETGNFTGWETFGRTSIKTSAYGSGPTEGTYQALLSTFCPTLVNNRCKQDGNFLELNEFLNVNALDLTTLGNVFEGSAIKTTLTVKAGDVLTFDWDFLTNSVNGDTSGVYNDFAFVTIAKEADKLADTFSPFVGTVTGTDFEHQTGFKKFSYSFTTSGTYTLGIGVVDVGDGANDSGLLVDNVLLSSTPIPNRIPEPTSILGVLAFGIFGIGIRRSRRP